MEEFREVSSRIVIPEPFVDGGDVIKACDTFFNEVIAVDEDVMDSVTIAAVRAIGSITG